MSSSKLPARYHPLGHIHQNDALLFQFILHEFLATFSLLSELSQSHAFDKLIGDTCLFQMQYPLSHRVPGSLVKLQHYLFLLGSHFYEKQSDHESTVRALLSSVEKALLLAMDYQKFRKKEENAFEKTLTQFKKLIRSCRNPLLTMISIYHQNENVLYFLLRRQKDFNLFFGKITLKQTLDSLFKGGMEEAGRWLVKRYQQRKFDHLVPSIQAQLLHLTEST